MAGPLVSVIIPTHNRRDLLAEAARSVLEQEGCRFELIIVDDGSTDASVQVLETLPAGELCWVGQSQRGVAAARNAGAREARGSWLAFLDSDDLWRPGKLAAQLAFHSGRPELSISQTEEIWIRNGRRVNARAYHAKPEGEFFRASLERCLVSPSAVMMRRDLFESTGGFDESLTVCEDYDLWLRLALEQKIGLIRQPLVIKRGGHADQLSRAFWGMDRFRVAALLKLLSDGRVTGERRRAVADVLSRKCAVLAQGARRRGRGEEAERYERLAAQVA